MTRKQIGAVCGAILLAVITPLLLLALVHGLDGTARAQPGALQDPTFSLSRGSAQVSPMGPYDAADLLTLSAGVVPPPVVALMCPVLLPFPSMFCEAYGGMPPFDDVNAGSPWVPLPGDAIDSTDLEVCLEAPGQQPALAARDARYQHLFH